MFIFENKEAKKKKLALFLPIIYMHILCVQLTQSLFLGGGGTETVQTINPIVKLNFAK